MKVTRANPPLHIARHWRYPRRKPHCSVFVFVRGWNENELGGGFVCICAMRCEIVQCKLNILIFHPFPLSFRLYLGLSRRVFSSSVLLSAALLCIYFGSAPEKNQLKLTESNLDLESTLIHRSHYLIHGLDWLTDCVVFIVLLFTVQWGEHQKISSNLNLHTIKESEEHRWESVGGGGESKRLLLLVLIVQSSVDRPD